MPNPLGADELVGELLDIVRATAQEHYFKTRVVVEMGMERRDNTFVVFMLKISELLGKKPSVVVIDQRYGSDDRSLRGHNCGSNKLVSDQVTKSLGSVVIALFSNELVKPIEQIRLQRHPDSADLCHVPSDRETTLQRSTLRE